MNARIDELFAQCEANADRRSAATDLRIAKMEATIKRALKIWKRTLFFCWATLMIEIIVLGIYRP